MKLGISRWELSDHTAKFLEKSSFCKEDYKSFWLARYIIADAMYEGRYPGMELPEDYEYDEKTFVIPERWWIASGFSSEMRKDIEDFWKQYPEGEISFDA